MDVAETLRELEASLLTSAVRKNAMRVAELLADAFCEFGRSGTIYSKAEVLKLLADEEEIHVEMKEFVCRMISAEVALVTYRSERAVQGEEMIAALRSSLWARRDGRWQMVFHQGTPLNTPPGSRVKA
jgi:hypothetical protein